VEPRQKSKRAAKKSVLVADGPGSDDEDDESEYEVSQILLFYNLI
jgi:hypothetical protein